MSIARAVSVTYNARVFDKATAQSDARLALTSLFKSSLKEFRKVAKKGRGPYMDLIAKRRHPLAFGPYCNGVVRVMDG